MIPARYGSTRFPGKPLVSLAGKPLIQWVIEGARTSQKLTEIIVATDHDGIAKAARDVGCRAVMTDSNLPSGSDRIYQAIKDLDCDVVINIQGDEPLINKSWIDPVVDVFTKDPKALMATMAHPLSEEDFNSPNSVKVILDENSDAIYFSRFQIPFSKEKPSSFPTTDVLKHVGIYGYRKSFLKDFCSHKVTHLERAESLEQLRALAMGAKIRVVPTTHATMGVDTPEDLIKVEKIIQEMRK
ncbi:MAG: 3-deoxy-manno-octulosonate cytidylyltransferase [Bdellovibrionota bacterium]